MDERLCRMFFRTAEVHRETLNEETRELALSFSSEYPVQRWFGAEILLHGKENVDLSRLLKRGAVLMNHRPDIIVGPVKSAEINEAKRRGEALIGFDDDAEGEHALIKVKSGSLRGVSVAYAISKFREVKGGEEWVSPSGQKFTGPVYLATRWAPYEISLTPIPADPTVGVGRGREAIRSLEGIEIERLPHGGAIIGREETSMMDKRAKSAGELLRCAEMVSPECHSEAAMMVTRGKSELEIMNHILDCRNPSGNLRGRGPGKPPRSAAEIPEDEFIRAICEPIMFSGDIAVAAREEDLNALQRIPGASGQGVSAAQVDDDVFIRAITNPLI